MRPLVTLTRWAALACLALGCNSLLGIEEQDIVRKNPVGTGDAAPCSGDGCPAACSDTVPCPGDQRCVDGMCEPSGGSGTGGAGSGGVGGTGGTVAPPDSGAGGTAGSGDPDSGPDQPMPECEGDGLRCEGAAQIQRSQCVEGQWTAIDACENGELCDSASGECEPVVSGCSGREPGDAFCTGRERVVCGPDLVTAERETCPTIEHCQGSVDGKCLPCVANEHKCEGNQLMVCNADRNGFDTVMTCEDAPCNADLRMCTTLVCTQDSYSCNTATNTLRLCNADGSAYLQETPCGDGICDADGRQCDECAPNEFSCMSATEAVSCDSTGQTRTMASCSALTSASTPLCNDVKDACVACIAPSSSCIDAAREQACTDDGTWAAPAMCENQTCYQGKCTGECGPSVPPRCATGGGSEACGADGEWDTVESAAECPVCIGDGMCVACTTAQTRCDSATHQSTCVNNAWDVSTPCSNQTCVGNACTGECSPGQSQCRADGRYTCNAQGIFTRAEPCSMCQMEGTVARCVTCKPGDYICVGAELQRCNAQQTGFEFANRCASQALCDAANDRCVNQDCNPDETKCVGNELQTCNSTGSAHTTVACTGNTPICDAPGKQCDRCTPIQTACASSTQRSVCSSDGQTFTTPTCPTDTPACLNNECKPCNPTVTPTRCDNLNQMRTCQDNGTWGTATTCVNKTCTDSADRCDGECAQGQARCSTGTVFETCRSNGFFGNAMTCSGIGGVCTGAGVCRECANGVTRCDGAGRQYTCASNAWGSSFACSNQTCFGDASGLGGRCQGSCSPGQRICASGVRAWDACGANGQPDPNQRTTCSGTPASQASWDVCRNSAGAGSATCTPAQVERIGFFDAASSGQRAGLLNHMWLFQPVNVPARFKISQLSVLIASLTAGTKSFQLSIYSSRAGAGLQQPDRRITQTSGAVAVTGNNTLSTALSVILDPGNYWIGVKVWNGQSNQDPVGELHAYEVPAGQYLYYTAQPVFTDPPPDPYPAGQVFEQGYRFGVYATGKYEL